MATFAPDIPGISGSPFQPSINPLSSERIGGSPRYSGESADYLHYTHPISQPEPDRSGEIKLKGEAELKKSRAQVNAAQAELYKSQAGIVHTEGMQEAAAGDIFDATSKIIKTSVNAADAFIQKAMEQDVRKTMEEGRDQRLAQLGVIEGVLPGGTAAGGGKTTPAGVRDLGPALDLLNEARANGKLSETGYDQELLTRLKGVRSKYPEYLTEIDQTVRKITGRDPANDLIKSRMADINALLAGNKDDSKAFVSYVRTHGMGIPGMDTLLQGYEATRDDKIKNVIMGMINKKESRKSELADRIQENTLEEGDIKTAKDRAKIAVSGYLTGRMNDGVQHMMDATLKEAGITVQEMTSRSTPIPPENMAELGQFLLQNKTQYLNSAIKDLTSDPRLRAQVALIGVDEMKKLTTDSGSFWDHMMNTVGEDKDFRQVARDATFMKVLSNADTRQILVEGGKGGLGEVVRRRRGIIEAVGGNPDIAKDLLTVNSSLFVKPEFAGRLEGVQLRVYGEPNQPIDKFIKESEKLGIKEGKTAAVFYEEINKIPNILTNPKVPAAVKATTLDNFYNPNKNKDFIRNFDPDRMEGNRFIPGQYKVYNDLFSPDKIDAVWQLDRQAPGSWDKFKEHAEQTFSNVLFRREVKDLNDIQKIPGYKLVYYSEEGFHGFKLETDKAKPRFTSTPGQGATAPRTDPPDVSRAKNTLSKVNEGIRPLYNIYKKENGDVDVKIIQFIQTKVDTVPGTVASGMENAVKAAKGIAFTAPPKAESSKPIPAVPMSYEDFNRARTQGSAVYYQGNWYMKQPSGENVRVDVR